MTQPTLPGLEPAERERMPLSWIRRKVETGYAIHDLPEPTVEALRESYGDHLHVIGPDPGGLYAVSLHGLYSEIDPYEGAA